MKELILQTKKFLKRILPKSIHQTLHFIYHWEDLLAALSFIFNGNLAASFQQRFNIVKKIYQVNYNIKCAHTQSEILEICETILTTCANKRGVFVEAGCFKGGSTSKFSLATDIIKRELVVFDSFEGIPENNEVHGKNIFGWEAGFGKGDYCGSLAEVKHNVKQYGKIDNCHFIKGWFDETMPKWEGKISAAYIDVDLASSTKTCLKYLYPKIESGGVFYSQDGHLPLVIDVLNDNDFWQNELGIQRPKMVGLGKKKLVKIIKE